MQADQDIRAVDHRIGFQSSAVGAPDLERVPAGAEIGKHRFPVGRTDPVAEIVLAPYSFQSFNPLSGKMENCPGPHTLYYGTSSDPADLRPISVDIRP